MQGPGSSQVDEDSQAESQMHVPPTAWTWDGHAGYVHARAHMAATWAALAALAQR